MMTENQKDAVVIVAGLLLVAVGAFALALGVLR